MKYFPTQRLFYCLYLVFFSRRFIIIGGLLIFFQYFLQKQILPYQVGSPDYLAIAFFIGVAFCFLKNFIQLSWRMIFFFLICYFLTRGALISWIFLQLFFFCLVLYISATPVFLRYKPKVDISYGVYLWGYVVAQVLIQYYPLQSIEFNQYVTILISLLIGLLSAILIERPSILIGKKISIFIEKFLVKIL